MLESWKRNKKQKYIKWRRRFLSFPHSTTELQGSRGPRTCAITTCNGALFFFILNNFWAAEFKFRNSIEKSKFDELIIFVFCFFDFHQPDYYDDADHFVREGDGPVYKLTIPCVKLDFTGAYSVIARNVHGEAKAVISLQVYVHGKNNMRDSPPSIHLSMHPSIRQFCIGRLQCGCVTNKRGGWGNPENPRLSKSINRPKIVGVENEFLKRFGGKERQLWIFHGRLLSYLP